MTPELVERGGRLIVSTPFNPKWNDWAWENGGKWNSPSQGWTFHPYQRETVEAALAEIFGEDDDE